MADTNTSVLVIGAGLAGLAAGYHLINGGMSRVTILEADNRIGGRIHSARFGDSTVELGATWIHGNGPINELAEVFNLIDNVVIEDEYSGIYVSSDGKSCKKELVERARKEFGKMMEDVYKNKSSVTRETPPHPTFFDYMQCHLRQVLDALPESDRDEFSDIFRTLMKVEEENHGAALKDISPFVTDIVIPGRNINFSGCYSALITKLANTITDKRIHLETEVVNIDYTDPMKIRVSCKTKNDTKIYTADHVIVTPSLGVMKQIHQTLFSPCLPREKIQSIEQLGYGIANKVILYYKTPFWKPGENVKLVWRNHNVGSNNSLPSWTRCLYSFNSLLTSPNTLEVWLCGNEGREIEDTPNELIGRVLTNVLRQFLGDPTLPEPDSILKSTWFSNKLFRGSYAYIRAGVSANDIYTLAEPLVDENSKPVVLFAGDATDADYISSTHGALISGIREANRLLMMRQRRKATSCF